MTEVAVKYLNPDAKAPKQGSKGDAGYDLTLVEDVVLQPGEKLQVSTGISIQVPENCGGFIIPRSSTGKLDIRLANTVGLIDPAYRGEIMLLLKNTGTEIQRLPANTRVCQLVIIPVIHPTFYTFEGTEDEWFNTSRGTGSFGSTGV